MAAHDEKNFGLKEGMKVEIFSEGLIFLLNGVIDKIDEDAIWVTNAKGSEMPVIIHNSKVSIKAIRSDDTIIILHGAITGNSDTFWKIGQLSQFSFPNQRNNYRHHVDIETTVVRLAFIDDMDGGEYYPTQPETECTIHNISGGGLMFSCYRPFYLDDNVQFGPITLIPEQEPFVLRSQILRVNKNFKNEDKYYYGCQFFGMDDRTQERLIRQIFTMQAEEIRRKNRF